MKQKTRCIKRQKGPKKKQEDFRLRVIVGGIEKREKLNELLKQAALTQKQETVLRLLFGIAPEDDEPLRLKDTGNVSLMLLERRIFAELNKPPAKKE